MYLIGIIASYIELPSNDPDASVYGNLWLELFLDLYILCALLTIIPRKIRPWIRGLFCVIAYITTIVDVFCWEKFQSTLNPSMLLLVGETDGREASEFFNSYFSTDLIFSGVGLILLIMLIHILATILPGIIKKRCSPLRLSLNSRMKDILEATTGGLCLILLPWSVCSSAHNKVE